MTMVCKIDCLDFTIPNWKRENYLDYLGAEVAWLDRGFRGYKERGALSKGGNYAFTMGRDDGHFNLSGKALGAYIHDYSRLHGLLQKILADKGNISRIDLALDVKDTLQMRTVLKAVRQGCLVSRTRNLRIIEKLNNKKDELENVGYTVYVGSEKSNKMLRIYDKAKEQKEKGDRIRFELQLRDNVAMKVAERIVESEKMCVTDTVIGMLLSFVDFRKNDNENISRRTRLAWYDTIVSDVESVVLVFDKTVQTVTGLVDWVQRQVSPTLALLEKHFEEKFDGILDYLLIHGRSRLQSKHDEILLRAKRVIEI